MATSDPAARSPGIRKLLEQGGSDLLRMLTAGSVDDGKSTLIGRLLYDSKLVYSDQLRSLERDSRRVGSAGDAIDYSLLVDGLRAEREQGITIDVAYRYFSTPRRKFIIADCPGHEQYTRNMATGASTADLAIILIDAQNGVLPQTRRHSFIASLLGIKHLVVCVNKMDLVGYDEEVFDRIRGDFSAFAARLEVGHVHFLPMSALRGDNVVEPSPEMAWFSGAPLLRYLEQVHIASDRNLIDLRFPVQYVLRQEGAFRGYCGTVASGVVRPGDELVVLPSGRRTRVERIVSFEGELDEAFSPMAVTLTLADQLDISRGDMLVHARNVPRLSDSFEAVVVWMNEEPLRPQRPYLIKHNTHVVRAQVDDVRYRFDVNTLHRQQAEKLELNEIGRLHLRGEKPLALDPYARNRSTGRFILVDPASNATIGAGMVLDRRTDEDTTSLQAGRASGSVRARTSLVSLEERIARLGQRPATIWLTGLPKAGKSTLAHALERQLFDEGLFAHVLDGENLRLGISTNLGFDALERAENVRRAAHIARLCNDLGMITIVALVSPYAADRMRAREVIGPERFFEVYLSAPLEACEQRDDEGLYARARRGEIDSFTGLSAPYEIPGEPSLELPTHEMSVADSVARLMGLVRSINLSRQ